MWPSDTDNHLHQFGLFCHCVFKLGGNYLLYPPTLPQHPSPGPRAPSQWQATEARQQKENFLATFLRRLRAERK